MKITQVCIIFEEEVEIYKSLWCDMECVMEGDTYHDTLARHDLNSRIEGFIQGLEFIESIITTIEEINIDTNSMAFINYKTEGSFLDNYISNIEHQIDVYKTGD